MENKKLICYEQIHGKINWKYTSLKDDFEEINVTELNREVGYCYGSNQYIMRFIETLKHKVIRFLPELKNVEIILGIFDKNNVIHRLLIGVYNLINNMLKSEIHMKNIYKTIFTIIKYKGKIVFIGDLSFDGID